MATRFLESGRLSRTLIRSPLRSPQTSQVQGSDGTPFKNNYCSNDGPPRRPSTAQIVPDFPSPVCTTLLIALVKMNHDMWPRYGLRQGTYRQADLSRSLHARHSGYASLLCPRMPSGTRPRRRPRICPLLFGRHTVQVCSGRWSIVNRQHIPGGILCKRSLGVGASQHEPAWITRWR